MPVRFKRLSWRYLGKLTLKLTLRVSLSGRQKGLHWLFLLVGATETEPVAPFILKRFNPSPDERVCADTVGEA